MERFNARHHRENDPIRVQDYAKGILHSIIVNAQNALLWPFSSHSHYSMGLLAHMTDPTFVLCWVNGGFDDGPDGYLGWMDMGPWVPDTYHVNHALRDIGVHNRGGEWLQVMAAPHIFGESHSDRGETIAELSLPSAQ